MRARTPAGLAMILSSGIGLLLASAAAALGAPQQWIVAPARTPEGTALARASGAHRVDPVLGIWTAPAPVAHRLAGRLRARGLLRFEEPDVRLVPQRMVVQQAATGGDWWRAPALAGAGETPVGPGGPASAPIAMIEFGGFDASHPDIPPSVTLRRPPTNPLIDTAHGTAIASLIAGRGPGVLGLSPGADVRVYGGSGFCSDAAGAIRQAVADGAKVITMSYGFSGPGPCLAHRVATSFASAFAVVVASAGNDRAQPWTQPANDYHVLTVGSLNAVDQPTGFSNQSTSIDISAPGEAVGVACPVPADVEDGVPDGHCTWSGTSFSAPIVAAIAARVRAARPDLTGSQVQILLALYAHDLGKSGWDISTGYGRVDLAAALAAPAPVDDVLEPNDDVAWVDGHRFRPDQPLLRFRRNDRFFATVDALKDPVDVYPVWVGPHESIKVTLNPKVGRLVLSIHYPNTRSVATRGSVIAAAPARPGRRGVVEATNYTAKGVKIWVAIVFPKGPDQLFTDYRLTLRRG
jgi:Subtilase family